MKDTRRQTDSVENPGSPRAETVMSYCKQGEELPEEDYIQLDGFKLFYTVSQEKYLKGLLSNVFSITTLLCICIQQRRRRREAIILCAQMNVYLASNAM